MMHFTSNDDLVKKCTYGYSIIGFAETLSNEAIRMNLDTGHQDKYDKNTYITTFSYFNSFNEVIDRIKFKTVVENNEFTFSVLKRLDILDK